MLTFHFGNLFILHEKDRPSDHKMDSVFFIPNIADFLVQFKDTMTF